MNRSISLDHYVKVEVNISEFNDETIEQEYRERFGHTNHSLAVANFEEYCRTAFMSRVDFQRIMAAIENIVPKFRN